MQKVRRLLVGLLMFGVIYWISLYVVPRLGLIRQIRAAQPWIGPGDVTQVCFLLLSLFLMLRLGRGRLGAFGFRGVSLRWIGKALLTALLVSVPISLVGMILIGLLSGPRPGEAPGEGPLGGGFLGTVLSVWILASACEEVFYRGLLQSYLDPLREWSIRIGRRSLGLHIVLPALAFGLGHLCLWGMLPRPMVVLILVSATVLGLLAGHYRDRTGSLIPAYCVHVMFNVTGMLLGMLLAHLGPA